MFMNQRLLTILLSALVIGFLLIRIPFAAPAASQTTENVQEQITRLIVNMPASSQDEEHWINEQLLDIGSPAVEVLSGMLKDPAIGSDLKPRYALSSLINYVARPGAEQQREWVESALLDELRRDRPVDVTVFLMEQLSLIGGDASVPVVQNYLWHQSLYNPALRTLFSLESEQAAEAIRGALTDASGSRQIAVIKALGELGDEQAADHIEEFADSDSWSLARISLFALAEIGQPGHVELFEQAIGRQEGFRQSELKSFYLRYGRQLAARGYDEEAESIAVYFSGTDQPSHLQSQALELRFAIHGQAMADELAQIAEGSAPELARTARELTESPGAGSGSGSSDAYEDIDGFSSDQFEPDFIEIFNGENLNGWKVMGDHSDSWGVEDGILFTDGVGSGWLATEQEYDDFVIELEYRVPEGGNSGVFIRAPEEGNPAYQGFEVQILDDYAERYAELQPWQYTGSIYDVKAPSKRVTKPAGEWQSMKIRADGPLIQVTVNGEMILSTSLINHMEKADGHPGLKRRSGYIGLQNHSNRVDFRNIRIKDIQEMEIEERR